MQAPEERAIPPAQIQSQDLLKVQEFQRLKNTSILVIMFTDMAGSTELRDRVGEEAFEQIRELHNRLLGDIIGRDGAGQVVKDIGDAIMAVFSSARQAVERAIEIQNVLAEHPDVPDVRIGLDMGEVSARKVGDTIRDIFGHYVNRAARVEALADGGHVCVTAQVWDNAQRLLDPRQVSWRNHGAYKLKGIAAPVEIYEPYNANLRPPMPALRSTRCWR